MARWLVPPEPPPKSRLRAPAYGVKPEDLASAGWGVVYPLGERARFERLLADLLELRKKQAGDPHRLPYYLLLVGSPEQISFQFQGQLDQVFAVGRCFRPRDLFGPIETRMRRDRPLVFLNACQAARQTTTLTRLGGWVPRWTVDCGCAAFLGPLWAIDDAQAAFFSTRFYTALEEKATLAAAVRKARNELRAEFPTETGWLAYNETMLHFVRSYLTQAEAASREPDGDLLRPIIRRQIALAVERGEAEP